MVTNLNPPVTAPAPADVEPYLAVAGVITPKPGITTTEFWKTAIVAGTALLSRWLSPDVAVQIASLAVACVAVAAYSISRGLAKKVA